MTVKEGRLESIEFLRHDNGKGGKAEAMIEEMVRNNDSEVDLVSGATVSSICIRSAARNALAQGRRKYKKDGSLGLRLSVILHKAYFV